jgi:radical SAM superfamily enzyme YgiQ (UPF0313 family)
LINPTFPYVGKDNFPIGLGYIAACIIQQGHHIIVVDENMGDTIPWDLIDQFDIIGFTSTTPAFPRVKEILSQLNEKKLPTTIIIAGGHHPTFRSEELLEIGVNIVIRGEGDNTIIQLFERLSNDQDWHILQGISYKENDLYQHNPLPPLIQDLDALPFPAWNLFNYSKYDPMSVITSRGCPYKCSYCAAANFWEHKIRFRSISNVIQELDELTQLFPYTQIKFQDSAFTVNEQRTIELLNAMISKDYSFQWICETRADNLNENLIQLMKQAKCKVIMLGIESGSQRVLDRNQRSMSIEKIIQTCELIKKQGIGLRFSVIFGLPGENKESVEDTIQLLKRIQPNITFLNLATIYPGCAMECCPTIKPNEKWVQSIGGHGIGADLVLPEGMTARDYRTLANHLKREIKKINRLNWPKNDEKT